MSGINREAWLAAVQFDVRPVTDDPNALTMAEFAELHECARSTAERRLKLAVKAGTVEVVCKWVTSGDGRRMRTRAYRPVGPEAQKKRR